MASPGLQELASREFRQNYRIIAKLGEGGMAVVHLALARCFENISKLVVLKSVKTELVSEPRVRSMFMEEARLAAKLNHPNVVQTYETILLRSRPVMVMEYMEGQPLLRILASAQFAHFPLAFRLFVLREALSGLEYVHNATDYDGTPLNLVHRDVSPQNVFVTYDGHVKILDFGVAKAVGSAAHTATGEIKGKIRYMSPEQIIGSAAIDRRVDIYAVGVMLWESLTERRLWDGMSDVQVVHALVSKSAPSPDDVRPDLPAALVRICNKALAPAPADRYTSAAEMQAALDAATDALGLRMTSREAGSLISTVCAEVRASMKQLIERQLRDDAARAVHIVPRDSDTMGIAVETGLPELEAWGVGDTPAPPTVQSVAPPRRGGRLAVGSAVAVACLAVVFWFAFGRGASVHWTAHAAAPGSPDVVRAAPAAADAPAPPSAAAPPATAVELPLRVVPVTLEAVPARAELLLDGVALAANPFHGELPRDGAEHTLTVQAAGYRAKRVAVWLTAPVQMRIQLEPSVPRPNAPHPTGAAASASSPAPEPAKAVVACNPPYTLDGNGIKVFKPECF